MSRPSEVDRRCFCTSAAMMVAGSTSLTDPVAHGGTAADAFDVVIPSLPGYGFSAKPTEVGWNPPRIVEAWVTLMHHLGYQQSVAVAADEVTEATAPADVIARPGILSLTT